MTKPTPKQKGLSIKALQNAWRYKLLHRMAERLYQEHLCCSKAFSKKDAKSVQALEGYVLRLFRFFFPKNDFKDKCGGLLLKAYFVMSEYKKKDMLMEGHLHGNRAIASAKELIGLFHASIVMFLKKQEEIVPTWAGSFVRALRTFEEDYGAALLTIEDIQKEKNKAMLKAKQWVYDVVTQRLTKGFPNLLESVALYMVQNEISTAMKAGGGACMKRAGGDCMIPSFLAHVAWDDAGRRHINISRTLFHEEAIWHEVNMDKGFSFSKLSPTGLYSFVYKKEYHAKFEAMEVLLRKDKGNLALVVSTVKELVQDMDAWLGPKGQWEALQNTLEGNMRIDIIMAFVVTIVQALLNKLSDPIWEMQWKEVMEEYCDSGHKLCRYLEFAMSVKTQVLQSLGNDRLLLLSKSATNAIEREKLLISQRWKKDPVGQMQPIVRLVKDVQGRFTEELKLLMGKKECSSFRIAHCQLVLSLISQPKLLEKGVETILFHYDKSRLHVLSVEFFAAAASVAHSLNEGLDPKVLEAFNAGGPLPRDFPLWKNDMLNKENLEWLKSWVLMKCWGLPQNSFEKRFQRVLVVLGPLLNRFAMHFRAFVQHNFFLYQEIYEGVLGQLFGKPNNTP